jgi:ABC-2 type transport system ATP-binding protein
METRPEGAAAAPAGATDADGAIEVRELTMRYGDLIAVDDLSLSVGHGEILGLLGPNGAGKSTLINTLCTLLRPTEGSARVAGHDVAADPGAVRQRIGVVFQEPALDEELTAAENLLFHGRLYGMSGPALRERVTEVLDLVDLADRRDDEVGDFSGGMARRLELARGLMHDPEVLFLDEPTVGLDAGTREATREYVRRLNERTGVTVVLTTHYMEEADALCDRVAIVDRGRLVAADTPARLKAALGGDGVDLGVDGDPGPVADRLRSFAWVETVAVGEHGVEAVVDDGARRLPALLGAAGEVGEVTTVSVSQPTLERVFLALTGRTIEDAEREARADADASDTDSTSEDRPGARTNGAGVTGDAASTDTEAGADVAIDVDEHGLRSGPVVNDRGGRAERATADTGGETERATHATAASTSGDGAEPVRREGYAESRLGREGLAVFALWRRDLTRFLRSRAQLVGTFVTPLFLIGFLGFGFRGVEFATLPDGVDYLQYLVPGVIGFTTLFSASFTGLSVLSDREGGFLKEILVTPASRTSIVLGRIAGGATTTVIQVALVLAGTLLLGFRPVSVGGVVLGAGFLVGLVVTFIGFGLAMASQFRDSQGFSLLVNFTLFPLAFLSGAFYPLENLPGPVALIGRLNPLTYGIDGLRAALAGQSAASYSLAVDAGAVAVAAVVTVGLGAWLFGRVEPV